MRRHPDTIEPSHTRQTQTVRLEPRHGFSRLYSPHELWRFREVAVEIAWRDIKVRYRQTFLGAGWAILQPVATMVVFSIFFGRVAGISSDGVPYWLFSLTALVPWTFFSSAMSLGSDSVVRSASLVSKIYFPRIFIPVGVIAAGLLDFGIAFVILLVCVFVDGRAPTVSLLLVPVLVVIMVFATLGITSLLSAVNVRYRDVRYALPFMVQLWLFATPVAYPASLIHEPWRTLLAINPMAGVVEGFRWAVLGSGGSPWAMIAVSAASSLVLLAVGLAYFGRTERGFADIV